MDLCWFQLFYSISRHSFNFLFICGNVMLHRYNISLLLGCRAPRCSWCNKSKDVISLSGTSESTFNMLSYIQIHDSLVSSREKHNFIAKPKLLKFLTNLQGFYLYYKLKPVWIVGISVDYRFHHNINPKPKKFYFLLLFLFCRHQIKR